MSDSLDTTRMVHQRPVRCPVCGYYSSPDAAYCDHCGHVFTAQAHGPEPLVTGPLTRHPHPLGTERQDEARFEPGATAILQVLPSGTCLSLVLDEPLILGRRSSDSADSENMLSLSDFNALRHGVSRQHCMFRRHGGHLLVTDLGSTNHTYLNDQILYPNQDYVVSHGDKLILGSLHIVVFFSTAM